MVNDIEITTKPADETASQLSDVRISRKTKKASRQPTNARNARRMGIVRDEDHDADEPKQDNPLMIKWRLAYFGRVQFCATQRKTRLEVLMSRRVAKSWSPAKKAQMVRRLMTANQELEQATLALEQLTHRLQQLGQPASPVAANIPFIPPLPTSV